MLQVHVFPGQGSQFKGMGADLFPKYPEFVKKADDILGYSIVELCENDPDEVLNLTQYTQPALFVINALSYFEEQQKGNKADVFVGHSLGEFNALLAAGAYDFETGLKIVKERGRIMAKASGGAMAAVIGLTQDKIEKILAENSLSGIDIANINSSEQIIISGNSDEIDLAADVFNNAGARFIKLKVSAAFHSRYMKKSQAEFREFLDTCELSPLKGKVVSNWSADFYPEIDYLNLMENQLSNPVKWYLSISKLIASADIEITEVGPGMVLTRLCQAIQKSPELIQVSTLNSQWQTLRSENKSPKNVFMFSGQGSQYYLMGRELYDHDVSFRNAMDECNSVFETLTGLSLVEELYLNHSKTDDFTNIRFTHPAIFSFGYSLNKSLESKGIKADAVLGYSLGEFVAAVIANSLSLEQALEAIVAQADALSKKATNGGMLTVLTEASHFDLNPDIYENVEVAGINYAENFVVSGAKADLLKVKEELDRQSIISMMLPVEHGFHSNQMSLVESEYRQSLKNLNLNKPSIPIYSCSMAGEWKDLEGEHFWNSTRGEVKFHDLIRNIKEQETWRFIDLSPTGTLATFLKYGFQDLDYHVTVNQFGRDLESIDKLVAATS